jgi:hypothetical protein
MLKSGDKIQKLLTVFITWAALVILFLGYEQYFVNRQKEFLKARAFNSLGTLSEELGSQIYRAQLLTETYARLAILQGTHAQNNADPVDFIRLYFGGLNQQHALEGSVKVARTCVNVKDRVPLQSDIVESDLKNLALSISCFTRTVPGKPDSPELKSKTYLYTLDLTPWIRNAFQPLGSDFDDLLLADSSGQVLFQKATITPRIVDFKSLIPNNERESNTNSSSDIDNREAGKTERSLPHSGPTKSGPSTNPPAKSSFTPLTRNSALTQINVAGEPYELFSMPSPEPLTGPLPGRTWELVVFGMWRASTFDSQSRAIPYSTLIWAALITLALFSLSWPVFKLRYMSNTERFTAAEGWYLVLTIFLASTSATIMLLNASYTSRAREATDNKLKELASRINASYEGEMAVAYRQLQHFQPDRQNQLLTPNYLLDNGKDADIYPYFEIAYWVGGDGQQVRKFDVRPAATPGVNVSDLPFFKRIISDLESQSRSIDKASNNTKSGGDHEPLQFDSVYLHPQMSITTNEFVAGLAAPFSGNPKNKIRVEGLTMRPMSLVDPVLPPGFGFAVIDDQCRVLFHAESFKNLREDFCRESKQPTELQPWLFGGRNAAVDISYSGRPERAFITSLAPPRFAAGRSFLVVFEESDHQMTPNLAIVLVCAILLGAYFALLLFGAIVHISLRGPLHKIYVPRLMWACAENSLGYLQIAAALGAILFLFWVFYLRLYEAPLLTLTFLVAALAPLLAILKLRFRATVLALFGRVLIYISIAVLIMLAGFLLVHSPAFEEWWSVFVVLGISGMIAILLSGTFSRNLELTSKFPRAFESLKLFARNHFGLAYSIASLTVIAAVFLVPSVGCFKYAYDAVTELSLKHDEITLSERLAARKDRIVEYYHTVKVNNPRAEIHRRLAQPWDRYDNCSFAVEQENDTADYFSEDVSPMLGSSGLCGTSRKNEPAALSLQTEKLNLWIERLIAKATLSFPSNRLGSEISKLGVASSEEPRDSWEHSFTELEDTNFRLRWTPRSRLPHMTVLAAYTKWRGMRWWASLGMLLLWIVLGLWLMSLVRKIFFTEVPYTHSFDEVGWKDVKEVTSNFLVVGRAKSGKTAWLKSISGLTASDCLDLRVNVKQIKWGEYPSGASHRCPVIVLDHFDFNLKDRDSNLAKLELLEKLLYEEACNLVVVSIVEPLYFLSEGPPEWLSDGKDPELIHRLLDRWARVLSKLTTVRPPESHDDTFNKKIKAFLQFHEMHRPHRQFAVWVRQECHCTVMLREIGKKILDNFQESDPVTREWIQSSVLDRADDYYHVLWSGLSAGERLALYQLALDGWVNPKNIAALQQLERKTLIRRRPMYRLMNESFREFVQGTEHADEIEQWEKHEKQSTWRAFRLVLIAFAVGATGWLLHSQAALSQIVVAYIAGIGTLLTAIAGLLGRSGVKSSPKPEGTQD